MKKLVYQKPSAGDDYLRHCLEECRDLRSDSLELQEKIRDRYSQYHLSPSRANLLRWLDLGKARTVLERGAGCGAITRYLGEQGLKVHAVEACPDKASLARLRCRDLSNVRVIQAPFDRLPQVPGRYDLIVDCDTPGSGQRRPDNSAARQSPIALLRSVEPLLRVGGILAVAVDNGRGQLPHSVENRAGQREQGISLEDEVADILTEGWACTCFYPFPDHRFPRVLLADQFIETDEYSYSLLYRVLAREQPLSWQAGEDEFLHWKTLCEAGRLGASAPAALMLIARDVEAIRRTAPYDFVHYSSEARRREYRTVTFKRRGADRVEKRRLYPAVQDGQQVGDKVRINEIESRYEQGPLVTTLWLKALLAGNSEQSFIALLRAYSSFVREQSGLVPDNASLVDLLPSNLVAVAGNGPYKVIDQEWIFTEPFPVEYILFRALLWFGYHNRSSLATCCGQQWQTVGDFVAFWFQRLGLPLQPLLRDFIRLEDEFHAQVVVKGYPFTTLGLLAVKMNT